jgi:hypothetical protein
MMRRLDRPRSISLSRAERDHFWLERCCFQTKRMQNHSIQRMEKRPSPAKSSRLRFGAALFLFLACSSQAESWQSQQLNFAIDLPTESGWTRFSPPADVVKVSIRSADRTKVISVCVLAIDRSVSEESFFERFKIRWFEHGTGKAKSEEHIQLGGKPGYRLKDTATIAGKNVYRADSVVIDDGRLYQIDAMGVAADPFTDPAVLSCVASFRFLSQTVAVPAPSAPADKLPELIADITFACLAGLFVLFIFVKLLKNRKRRPDLAPTAF